MTSRLNELDGMGLAVFCGAYRSLFTAGTGTSPMDWRVAIITVTANDDPRIVKAGDRVQVLPVLMPNKQHSVF